MAEEEAGAVTVWAAVEEAATGWVVEEKDAGLGTGVVMEKDAVGYAADYLHGAELDAKSCVWTL